MTLVRCINLLERPTKGDVIVNNQKPNEIIRKGIKMKEKK